MVRRKGSAQTLQQLHVALEPLVLGLQSESRPGSLQGQLDHTYIVDEQGNKRKLKKKGE